MITYGLFYKLIIILIFIPFIISNIRRKKSIYFHTVFLGFMIYVVFLVGVLFFPVIYDKNIIFYSEETVKYLNLIPLDTIISIIEYDPSLIISQILGNIIIFIPLGFFLPIFSSKIKSLANCFVAVLLISSSIEIIQLLLDLIIIKSYRVCDIDDIILNVSGGMCGFILYRFANKWFKINDQLSR
ncbi:MAG: VanZ family protein [Clostridiaceae bacterium]|nr:VanZ family protein [Clostridiaceae bacterium]